MARTSERRREAVALYEYPEHLRPELDALPRAPGVYVFHGEGEGGLPLYIGKSIDIRGRVMDHLRTPEEARLLRQARRISHQRTAGDIGAQLLEASLIKSANPLYNQKLRKTPRQHSLRLHRGEISVLHSGEADLTSMPDTYGLFSSPKAAMSTLRRLADDNRLCYTLLGLERGTRGRPCFRAMLKRCAGACHGGEDRAEHEERLRLVLTEMRVAAWPYPGAVALEERGDDLVQFHVVAGWRYHGSAPTLAKAKRIRITPGPLDRDAYRILRAPMLDPAAPVHALSF
ncbi:excinuclease Cho [Luteimonas sp. MHLX1A]|uniref:excinuclease Cho n=1 Tax=Alterluteimonas muca TaxID=2878684 RepID=UPI0031BA2861|nr:excinuclease Cho [Luteimonas sp. MHLX1A]